MYTPGFIGEGVEETIVCLVWGLYIYVFTSVNIVLYRYVLCVEVSVSELDLVLFVHWILCVCGYFERE